MRWNSDAYLIGSPEPVQRPDGSWDQGEPERTHVFCNRFSRGFDTTSDPDVGLMDRGEIQVRSIEYRDQQRVEVDGTEYFVTDVTDSGEFTRLRIERKIGSSDGV